MDERPVYQIFNKFLRQYSLIGEDIGLKTMVYHPYNYLD